MKIVEVGDVVVALGHTGRFEVIKLHNNSATLKLLAQSDSGPVDLQHILPDVPVSTLVIYNASGK